VQVECVFSDLGIIHPEEQQAAGNLTKHFLFESMAGLITPSVCVCVSVENSTSMPVADHS